MNTLTFPNRVLTQSLSPQVIEADTFLDFTPRPRPAVSTLEQALTLLHDAERVISSQESRIHALEKRAQTDDMTGLLNRTGFQAALRRELVIARRTEKHAGLLIVLDMDDFGQVNDLYGHEVGDTCLQTVANVLLNEVRNSDYVARLESDTFALLLPLIGMKAAGARLEVIERTLNNRVMHSRAHAIPLRASFGFAVLHETETPETLLMIADKKLYTSKARRKMGMKG